jgi:CRISPR-associated protein Cas1
MAILYITEQGAMLRRKGERLIIQKDEETLLDVPVVKIDGVMLFGGIGLTTPAIDLLLDNQVETAFFSLSGKLRGQLTPPKAKNNLLRFKQYDKCRDQAFTLGLARELIGAKIENARTVVQNFRANHPEVDLKLPSEQLGEFQQRCATEENLESLRGIEGVAAASYFAALVKMLPSEFGFQKRQRRPPPDPVNALLSFTYVLLGNELQALLDGMGFDPYLGFFHALDYGRPSLSLDLLEPLRPAVADRLVLSLCNLGILKPEDFSVDAHGARLLPEARKVYFRHYDLWLREPVLWEGDYGQASPRQVMRRSAEEIAAAIQDKRQFIAPRLKK